MKRTPVGTAGGLFFLFASLVLAAPAALAVPRLYVDSRSTTADPDDHNCALMLRELPRQALILAAARECGAACADPTLEPGAAAHDGDVRIGVDRKLLPDRAVLLIDLFDAANQKLDHVEMPVKLNELGTVEYDDLAGNVDELVQSKWLPIIAKQLSSDAKPPKWDAALPAAAETERLLGTIDFAHAFLAARLLNDEIRDSGESPARLGALVRAYTHLGESTRHLCGGQSCAMFARALLCADRLTRLAPNDPASWQHRAYAEALLGLPRAAEAHLKRADELAGGAPAAAARAAGTTKPAGSPKWLEFTRDLLAFRTNELFDKEQGDDAPLASYFAWLTVEHSPLQSLAINFARVAVQNNPGAVRAIDSLSANGGVGLLHETTEQAPLALNRLVASLADDNAVPEPVRKAIRQAVVTRFAVESIVTLLKTLDQQPDAADAGQVLPWSAFASIVRDCQFANALRRLYFVCYQWSVDPTDELNGWWPLLKDHRYAAVFLTFDRGNALASANDRSQRIAQLVYKDTQLHAMPLYTPMRAVGINNPPGEKRDFVEFFNQQADHTAYDLARLLWAYGTTEQGEAIHKLLAQTAGSLEQIAPNHPVGLAFRATEDWSAVAPRAQQIERDFGGNPIVAYGLGQGLFHAGKLDDASRLLEKTAHFAPDKEVYATLAEIARKQSGAEAWVAVWNTYLDKSEDFGLDHAWISQMIARHYMAQREFDKAMPYAQGAADSYSAWGLQTYAEALVGKGQYDEADKVLEASFERYGDPSALYFWRRMVNHGDIDMVRRAYRARISQWEGSRDAYGLRDAGLFYEMEGDLPRATDLYQRAFDAGHEPYEGMLAAVAQLEQKNDQAAAKLLKAVHNLKPVQPRDRAYIDCGEEISYCLKDAKALPQRQSDLMGMLGDPQLGATRGNVCYFFGRLCELRGHPDDAKWWYRQSIESTGLAFGGQPLSAAGLRRLGEDYFK